MNMTLEEAKLYHYKLWDEVVKELPHNIGMPLPIVKNDMFEKLRSKGLLPKERPIVCCYLCDYYKNNCIICPLNGCDVYYTLIRAFEEQDIDKAISLAKFIRDIYKKEG